VASQLAPRPRLTKLVFGWPPPEGAIDSVRQRFPEVEFVLAPGDAFVAALPDAGAAIAWSMTPAEYAAAKRLAWFQSIGAGVERVILPGMAKRGLIVTNTSGMHASNISEHVLSMMFAFARRLPQLVRAQARHEWRDEETRRRVFELEGQTLMVVGYGEIGQALGRKAHALGMRVIGIRRNLPEPPDPELAKQGTFGDLPVLVAEADHVAICLPQTPATVGLFGTELFAKMKPGAFIYNIGRGPIINSSALLAALERGDLGGAGLDVTDPEPLPADSPFWDRDDVLITAHTAGSSPQFWPRLFEILVDNIERYRSGAPLRNVVDLQHGY
jgi:phosphoglycerate dehydrogenase-like enzyme